MNNLPVRQIGIDPVQVRQHRPAPEAPGTSQFHDLLHKSIGRQDTIKFSAHAMERLRTRNISLSSDDISRLHDAVHKAQEKGSRDSLILMNDIAFVVSVRNKTVVTAMTGAQMRNDVVTNIDSTVLA